MDTLAREMLFHECTNRVNNASSNKGYYKRCYCSFIKSMNAKNAIEYIGEMHL